jgi:TolB protein
MTRSRPGLLLVTGAVGALAAAPRARAQEPVRQIVITGTQQRLALPDCVPEAGDEASRQACETVTGVLRSDLAFQGLFRFVDESLYSALGQVVPDAPDFEDWQSLFANFLVATRARVTGETMEVELFVYAVDSTQRILTRGYSGRSDEARLFAHRLADDVMALTPYEGIAQTRLVFSSDRDDPDGDGSIKELYIADYDGHNVRRMTVNRSLNILPAWSPDGSTLAYVSYRSGTPDVYLAQVRAGQSLNLTGSRGQSFAPAWSPDGRRVAYASSRSGDMEIWIANADGTDHRNVSNNRAADTAPTWSPNGREIAFTSNRGGTPQLWLMDADGLNVRRLTRVGSWSDGAVWSPSRINSEIAYSSRLEAGTFEVAVIDLETRQVRQLTTGRGSCEAPAWSPNGRHLVFACNRNRRWHLALVDRLGHQLQTLDVGPGNSVYPDWEPRASRGGLTLTRSAAGVTGRTDATAGGAESSGTDPWSRRSP